MSPSNSAARPQGGDADVGQIATLIGDPHRARILVALTDGRTHPASELADSAGLSRSAATSHLQQLVDGGLVHVEQVGRFRLHSLANPDVARLVEALAALAPAQPISSLVASNKAAALREGRTCYDHLAGRLGVAVADALRSSGAVLFTDPPAGVAAGGSAAGVRLGPAQTRCSVRSQCNCPHLRARRHADLRYDCAWTGVNDGFTSRAHSVPRCSTPGSIDTGSPDEPGEFCN